MPLVEFLLDPLNTNRTLERRVSPRAGKTRTVTSLYRPRSLESEVFTSINYNAACEKEGLESGHLEDSCELNIETGVQHKEKFDFVKLSKICQENPNYIGEQIQYAMDAITRKMETLVTDQVVANLGAFEANDTNGVASDIKTVKTHVDTNGNTSLEALEEIQYSARKAGFLNGTAYVFGDSLISKYFKRTESGCCLTEAGVMLDEFRNSSNIVFVDSHRVPDSLSANEGFIALSAGAQQLVWANFFEDPITFDTPDFKQGQLIDPSTGIPFDFQWKVDCADLYLSLSLPFKVCAVPDDMYDVGDRLRGVRGGLQFNVVNPS